MAAGSIFNSFFLLTLFSLLSLFGQEDFVDLQSYLLPENHPIKASLDAFFHSRRAIFNLKSLEKAGFKKSRPRSFTRLIITSHPSFPGYIFKLYVDVQRFYKNRPEYHFWKLRCKGARKIQSLIEGKNLQSLFKVPQKWIYILPDSPKPRSGYFPKKTLLVEEDMELLSLQENKEKWASNEVTLPMLEGLYLILKKIGLRDCTKPDNVPFSRDGKIAFIDTQTIYEKVHFSRLTPFLSKPNRRIWKRIYSTGTIIKKFDL